MHWWRIIRPVLTLAIVVGVAEQLGDVADLRPDVHGERQPPARPERGGEQGHRRAQLGPGQVHQRVPGGDPGPAGRFARRRGQGGEAGVGGQGSTSKGVLG